MSTIRVSSHHRAAGAIEHALRALAAELYQLACALISPNTIIAEVQQMHALQLEAARIQATHPARASRLRQQAARIGLR